MLETELLDALPVAVALRGACGARARLAALATITCVTRAVYAGVMLATVSSGVCWRAEFSLVSMNRTPGMP